MDAITAQLYGIADQLGEDMEKPSVCLKISIMHVQCTYILQYLSIQSDLVALTQNATQTGMSNECLCMYIV